MNITEFRTAIQDYAQNTETSFVTNNDLFLKHAELKIYRRVNLKVLRKNSSGSLTTSNRFLTTPTDFLTPYSLSIVNGGRHEYLLYKDVSFIHEAYPAASTTGTPKVYGIFDDDAFIVGPTPDSNYSAELYYFHIPTSIVTATNTWLGDNAEEALLAAAMVEAHSYLKAAEDVMAYWKQEREDCIQMLKNEYESKAQTDAYAYGALRTPPQ